MTPGSSAVVTVAFGHSTEHLDYTFLSFAEKNPGLPLHAFILGDKLPQQRLPQITYHLVAPIPDFSHPLREVYFRRHELIDRLDVEFAVVVDSYDVLCLQPLPPFSEILAGFAMASATEHLGSRHLMGQGYTSNFLNGGVTFWNIPKSREIRAEIGRRGRARFRVVADDQLVINEVVQTRYFDHVRILPSQFNYRAYLNKPQPGWPTVTHLDGVLIYHNQDCIPEAKALLARGGGVKPRAELPALPPDGGPLPADDQVLRIRQQAQEPFIIRESIRFQLLQKLMGQRWLQPILRLLKPVMVPLNKLLSRLLPNG
jgi:hypothetical protein